MAWRGPPPQVHRVRTEGNVLSWEWHGVPTGLANGVRRALYQLTPTLGLVQASVAVLANDTPADDEVLVHGSCGTPWRVALPLHVPPAQWVDALVPVSAMVVGAATAARLAAGAPHAAQPHLTRILAGDWRVDGDARDEGWAEVPALPRAALASARPVDGTALLGLALPGQVLAARAFCAVRCPLEGGPGHRALVAPGHAVLPPPPSSSGPAGHDDGPPHDALPSHAFVTEGVGQCDTLTAVLSALAGLQALLEAFAAQVAPRGGGGGDTAAAVPALDTAGAPLTAPPHSQYTHTAASPMAWVPPPAPGGAPALAPAPAVGPQRCLRCGRLLGGAYTALHTLLAGGTALPAALEALGLPPTKRTLCCRVQVMTNADPLAAHYCVARPAPSRLEVRLARPVALPLHARLCSDGLHGTRVLTAVAEPGEGAPALEGPPPLGGGTAGGGSGGTLVRDPATGAYVLWDADLVDDIEAPLDSLARGMRGMHPMSMA